MSDVTVIGLGAMGSAIARTELQAGHTVTVWNRSPDKIDPLVDIGASGSATLLDAIQASSHIDRAPCPYNPIRAVDQGRAYATHTFQQSIRKNSVSVGHTGIPSSSPHLTID